MTDKKIKEGLGELAHAAEMDHEVQMARADLYKTAKYAIKLHDMLKGVSETQGLEGWVQAKITKAADYIGSVYNHLDYEMKFGGDGGPVGPAVPMTIEGKEYCDCGCDCGKKVCESCGKPHKAKDIKEDEYKLKLASMLEKKLTPAEKKKREDVATAIEKDNPNMPMGKKMAIATATAKKSA